MAVIEIDEQTAGKLGVAAANGGLSIADYLVFLISQKPPVDPIVS